MIRRSGELHVLQFLGLLIDTVRQLVSIPVEKVQRTKDLIQKVLKKKKIQVHQLQKLCGYLNFLCRAIVSGRAFTRRLYAHTAGKVLKPHHHIAVNSEMKADLCMWSFFMNKPNIYCRPFLDYVIFPEVTKFYTDASHNFSLGFGGWCDSE